MRDCAIGDDAARRDFRHHAPDGLLKFRADQQDGKFGEIAELGAAGEGRLRPFQFPFGDNVGRGIFIQKRDAADFDK